MLLLFRLLLDSATVVIPPVVVVPVGGAIPKRNIYVPTADGVVQVDSLAQASRLLAKPQVFAPAQPIAAQAPAKPVLDYGTIDATLRAQIQAEMDEEEDLLMLCA